MFIELLLQLIVSIDLKREEGKLTFLSVSMGMFGGFILQICLLSIPLFIIFF